MDVLSILGFHVPHPLPAAIGNVPVAIHEIDSPIANFFHAGSQAAADQRGCHGIIKDFHFRWLLVEMKFGFFGMDAFIVVKLNADDIRHGGRQANRQESGVEGFAAVSQAPGGGIDDQRAGFYLGFVHLDGIMGCHAR